jgi:cytidine deaminase
MAAKPQIAKRFASEISEACLSAKAVQKILSSGKETLDERMLEFIPAASEFSLPSLSGFRVGAVALGASGALYFGANLEFEGNELGCTVHAEQSAVVNAAIHGETSILKLAVSAPPCGYCRQFLFELVDASKLQILLQGKPITKLVDYLPGAFGPADLQVTAALLSPQDQRLAPVSKKPVRPSFQATLRMAEAAYAPYTKALGAVGLTTRNGRTFAGPYLENAAFNPSLPPFQAAMIALTLAGQSLADVVEAAVVQMDDSKIDHIAATKEMLRRHAPQVPLRHRLVRRQQSSQKAIPMSSAKSTDKDVSCYFFDFDDNIMFLETPILIRNVRTNRVKKVSTKDFASIRHLLGLDGDWKDFQYFDGTYSHFSDIPMDQLKVSQRQYLVEDIEKSIATPPETWQAPSWPLFVYACEKQRPVAIITARGHSAETMKAGIQLFADKGLIPKTPNYLAIYAVGNAGTQKELAAKARDSEAKTLSEKGDHTSLYKRIAIRTTVELALESYGREPEHRFGMSDDDPMNVDLIIKAMCDCKTVYPDKRFFVINTHQGEWVKLEVFPVNFPVTGKAAKHDVVG